MLGTFLTEGDQDTVRLRKTMKKKGSQRSQSLSALPGPSRLGLGKTTSLRLLTMRARSRLTVSQTGSVSVLGGGPKPSDAMPGEKRMRDSCGERWEEGGDGDAGEGEEDGDGERRTVAATATGRGRRRAGACVREEKGRVGIDGSSTACYVH